MEKNGSPRRQRASQGNRSYGFFSAFSSIDEGELAMVRRHRLLNKNSLWTLLVTQLVVLLLVTLAIVPLLANNLGFFLSDESSIQSSRAQATERGSSRSLEEELSPEPYKEGLLRGVAAPGATTDEREAVDEAMKQLAVEDEGEGGGEDEENVVADLPLIHIVNTRFMQEQADLIHLAEARLELFETFCLPTMISQKIQPGPSNSTDSTTSSDYRFLWIIKTDPILDATIRDRMVSLLSPHQNFFLVGSNNNFGIGVRTGSWRGGEAGADVLDPKTRIYTGDITLLEQAHAAREDKIVVETRLDADDGLPSDFLEVVQDKALEYLDAGAGAAEADIFVGAKKLEGFSESLPIENELPKGWEHWEEQTTEAEDENSTNELDAKQVSAGNKTRGGQDMEMDPRIDVATQNDNYGKEEGNESKASWMFWCMPQSVNWYPALFSFFDSIGSPNAPHSFNPSDADPGRLEIDRNNGKVVCLTPGMTLGLSVGESDASVPRYSHYDLLHELAIQSSAKDPKDSCRLKKPTDCVQLVKMKAVRSRAPTSAGMKGLSTNKGEPKPEDIDKRWAYMNETYAITRERALKTNRHISDNAIKIMQDNLKGQCTKGHSCKPKSKAILRKMLETLGGPSAVPPKKPWEK